jgi:hypothetical protein
VEPPKTKSIINPSASTSLTSKALETKELDVQLVTVDVSPSLVRVSGRLSAPEQQMPYCGMLQLMDHF